MKGSVSKPYRRVVFESDGLHDRQQQYDVPLSFLSAEISVGSLCPKGRTGSGGACVLLLCDLGTLAGA